VTEAETNATVSDDDWRHRPTDRDTNVLDCPFDNIDVAQLDCNGRDLSYTDAFLVPTAIFKTDRRSVNVSRHWETDNDNGRSINTCASPTTNQTLNLIITLTLTLTLLFKVVSIQRNIITCPTYPETFIRDNVVAPLLEPSIITVSFLPPLNRKAIMTSEARSRIEYVILTDIILVLLLHAFTFFYILH